MLSRASLTRVLVLTALLGAAWAIAVAVTGGFHVPVGPMAISSRTPWRPLTLALVAAGAAIWLAHEWRGAALARLRRWQAYVAAAVDGIPRRLPAPRSVTLALCLLVAWAGWTFGSQTASGPDSFAYVSEAALWRTGRLDVPVPLASRAPWPDAPATFAPFGYRASVDGRSIVPVVAPGVPMVMALLQVVAGHRAAFAVTPLSAALLIWFTFVIGRRIRSGAVGLGAAWLVATSPAFLFMLMWPMTDIAAATCAAAMIAALLRPGAGAAGLAGLAAGAGVVTRPNFILIAAAGGLWLLVTTLLTSTRASVKAARIGAYAVALVPAAALMAWLNVRWFGSPFASGYGSPGALLNLDRVTVNASRYASWLAETSPLAFVGLAALALPIASLWTSRARPIAILLALTVVATVSLYLVYQPFVDWWYLRFLLPAWPALWIATCVVVAAASRWRIAGVIGVLLVVWAGGAGFTLARGRGVFALGEERYASVARLVSATTEPTAVILTWQHSGTLRYYAARETVRFDLLDPAWLDRAIAWLQARGRQPYILVDDWERPIFEARFKGASALAPLDFAPVATWESRTVAGRVFIYDPIRRDANGTADPGAVLELNQPRSAPSIFPRLAFER